MFITAYIRQKKNSIWAQIDAKTPIMSIQMYLVFVTIVSSLMNDNYVFFIQVQGTRDAVGDYSKMSVKHKYRLLEL